MNSMTKRSAAFTSEGCMKYLSLFSALCLLPLSLAAQSTPVGGVITNNTVWSPAMGTILVYSNVVVSNGATLTIQAGCVVRLTNNISINALAGCAIDVAGSSTSPATPARPGSASIAAIAAGMKVPNSSMSPSRI